MRKKTQKREHNHSRNLKIVLRELQRYNGLGGISLEDLAFKCGVSNRQIYRYLNELQSMGFEIIKTTNYDASSRGRYSINDDEKSEDEITLPLINLLEFMDSFKNEILAARLFIREVLLRNWLMQQGIILPLHYPIVSYDLQDAITVHRHTYIVPEQSEEIKEEIRIKVSPKIVNNVLRSLASEVSGRQRQRDGSYIFQITTKRIRDMVGLLTQWGSGVEVIQPSWLQHKLLENCKAILCAHRQRKSSKAGNCVIDGYFRMG
ncbi:WYL domain-containing protein [Desulforamulus aquiferis]|uniref:WYL domain-containing protein n=1 Tax=Desulforamulus aquiferis TaxID=1397668 RepID=A0AAW7ZD53_9FIRM|nr:WYL domain-containing protein [Desulforamulus aquiferis]MDO7787079.1 WYL domain-containing protein [Desulforamulus aquiferis]